MAGSYSKIPLSNSSHGRGIKVAATTIGSPDSIHTAEATTTDGLGDNVTIYAVNTHTADILLTLLWGGTTDPDDTIPINIPFKAGLILVTADLFLRNALIVKAFAAVTNKIILLGSVNRIS